MLLKPSATALCRFEPCLAVTWTAEWRNRAAGTCPWLGGLHVEQAVRGTMLGPAALRVLSWGTAYRTFWWCAQGICGQALQAGAQRCTTAS